MRQRAAAVAAFALFLAAPAQAAQQLIPTPFPESLGGKAQIGGDADLDNPHHGAPSGRHQRLIPTPVPQSLGPDALGDPEPGGVRKHQHLRRTPYWRQYRRYQRD